MGVTDDTDLGLRKKKSNNKLEKVKLQDGPINSDKTVSWLHDKNKTK